MKNPFINGKYAVMRHAKDCGWGDNVKLRTDSVDVCRRVVGGLIQHVAGKRIAIFYSPARRAGLTAELVRDVLTNTHNMQITSFSQLEWLDCEKYTITGENIAGVLKEDDDTFTLFISHQPDIESYLGPDYGTIRNCSIIAGEFRINGI